MALRMGRTGVGYSSTLTSPLQFADQHCVEDRDDGNDDGKTGHGRVDRSRQSTTNNSTYLENGAR